MTGDDLVRLAKMRDLRRVSHGVYALLGSFAGPREETIAGWLRLVRDRLPWDRSPPPAVVSHASAASIHGFGTLVPVSPTFTVQRRRFQPSDKSVRLSSARLDPIDWEWVALPEGVQLPVTTAARTIVDLAFAGEDRGHVLDALAEALEGGSLDEAAFAEAVERLGRRPGRGTVTWLADALPSR